MGATPGGAALRKDSSAGTRRTFGGGVERERLDGRVALGVDALFLRDHLERRLVLCRRGRGVGGVGAGGVGRSDRDRTWSAQNLSKAASNRRAQYASAPIEMRNLTSKVLIVSGRPSPPSLAEAGGLERAGVNFSLGSVNNTTRRAGGW